MASTIPKFLSTRKGREGMTLAAVVLLGILSFLLGRLSVLHQINPPAVALCNAPTMEIASTGPMAEGTGTQAAAAIGAVTASGKYVASKNGTAYHLPWCSGAKRISEENKVWFDTQEEAEAAGYRKASNCKGL